MKNFSVALGIGLNMFFVELFTVEKQPEIIKTRFYDRPTNKNKSKQSRYK